MQIRAHFQVKLPLVPVPGDLVVLADDHVLGVEQVPARHPNLLVGHVIITTRGPHVLSDIIQVLLLVSVEVTVRVIIILVIIIIIIILAGLRIPVQLTDLSPLWLELEISLLLLTSAVTTDH